MVATNKKTRGKTSPARNVEARENQLIAKAVDLAEQKLSDGTASSMVIVHYLKMGSTTARLEKEKLSRENELLKAKTEVLQSQKKTEELYRDALAAMRSYAGRKTEEDPIDEDPED